MSVSRFDIGYEAIWVFHHVDDKERRREVEGKEKGEIDLFSAGSLVERILRAGPANVFKVFTEYEVIGLTVFSLIYGVHTW